MFAIGLGLRAAYPSRMAVEHFDEGVYASNLYTAEGHYPFQHLYAPPLLPVCLEWAAIFGGPHGVMWVNVISGSLTLLVLWGMVRQWWGSPAAIAAMVLLAFNEFHIAYSRAALTDAMLGLWMTAGVWMGWRAIQFGGMVNLVAAGLLASLAWWTKYNGWLTLAITGSGTAGWVVAEWFGKPRGSRLVTVEEAMSRRPSKVVEPTGRQAIISKPPFVYGVRWGLTAAIAFLAWSPWLWSLQQYGGYAAVAKNHAGYFTGLKEWGSNFEQQAYALAHYCRVLSYAGFLLGLAIVALLAEAKNSSQAEDVPSRLKAILRNSSFWVLLAWVIGLMVAVPLYTPYPRLNLPLVIAGSILLLGLPLGMSNLETAGVSEEARRQESAGIGGDEKSSKGLMLLYALFFAMSAGREVMVMWTALGTAPIWEERTSLAGIARGVVNRLQNEPLNRDINGVRCVIYVVAEPGLFFHLGAAQRNSPISHLALPAADYSMAEPGSNSLDLPAYVVVGPHADQAQAERLLASGRLERVADFEYRPSGLVLLDSRPAWELPEKDQPIVEAVRLLRAKP